MVLVKVASIESDINRTIIKAENLLMQSGSFNLPKRSHNLKAKDDNTIFEYVVINITEAAFEHPQKKQKQLYSGKQKQHIKVIYNTNIKQIIRIQTKQIKAI